MRTVFLLGILTGLGLVGCGEGITTERGKHRGYISDVSEHGVFCHTWEGQIMSGAGNSSMHYEFTITNEETFHELAQAQRLQQEVNVNYKSTILSGFCTSRHNDFVESVEILK